MLHENVRSKIISIWDNYVNSENVIIDPKGKVVDEIDQKRLEAIEKIKIIIEDFLDGGIDIHEFKTNLDSYNKQNNLWGFTAAKGQMFFNHLVKTAVQNDNKISLLLKNVIKEPKDLSEALSKIETLENYCEQIFAKAKDKRKAPNPKSVGYFLSYFWQIYNPNRWPVLFSSIIVSFIDIGIWPEVNSQREAYQRFYDLNEEIKNILEKAYSEAYFELGCRAFFWNFRRISSTGSKNTKVKNNNTLIENNDKKSVIEANFDLTEYIIPKVSKLVELGNAVDKSGSVKGYEFEKLVTEVFKQIGFEVQLLGQGSGRNPDAIIKFREDHTAFIVDAKAYLDGYMMGRDDRAIKEYITYHCPQLKKEGFTKMGFIIVSNSFKSDLNDFINEITWQTDIKRFKLITSEALLYFLAYKAKDESITLPIIIESIINSEDNIITAEDVIQEFEDI